MKFSTPDNTRDPSMYQTYIVPTGFGTRHEEMEFIEYSAAHIEGQSEIIIASLDGRSILWERRNQLGLTQQQVADQAGIQVVQYQKMESGERKLENTTMRIGLSVLAVLKLFPYEVFSYCIRGNTATAMSAKNK